MKILTKAWGELYLYALTFADISDLAMDMLAVAEKSLEEVFLLNERAEKHISEDFSLDDYVGETLTEITVCGDEIAMSFGKKRLLLKNVKLKESDLTLPYKLDTTDLIIPERLLAAELYERGRIFTLHMLFGKANELLTVKYFTVSFKEATTS